MPEFKCACGSDLTEIDAKVGLATESTFDTGARVEITVECRDCERQYFAFVPTADFMELE